jgi:uncharacterized protein (TIGR03083 family)
MARRTVTDDKWKLVRQERVDVLSFLRELSAEQWETPSLCEGWKVRDVAIHLLVEEAVSELGLTRTLMKMVRWRFSVDRANAWWVDRNSDRLTSSIVEGFAKTIDDPGRYSRLLGPEVGLRANVIHHQDMRRPLGQGRSIPPERLIAVLNAVVTQKGSRNLGSRERSGSLRLRATDVEWESGDGPEVSGPGEAILMVLAGRSSALNELSGEGKDLLAARDQPTLT